MWEQILLHAIGDYITQTDKMATMKTKSMSWAWIHGVVYGAPFALLGVSALGIVVIMTTHMFIDRYRLARYVVFAKNWITDPKLKWKDCSATGYPKDVPMWMSVWLMIIADNVIHLVINYSAIRWLS